MFKCVVSFRIQYIINCTKRYNRVYLQVVERVFKVIVYRVASKIKTVESRKWRSQNLNPLIVESL